MRVSQSHSDLTSGRVLEKYNSFYTNNNAMALRFAAAKLIRDKKSDQDQKKDQLRARVSLTEQRFYGLSV